MSDAVSLGNILVTSITSILIVLAIYVVIRAVFAARGPDKDTAARLAELEERVKWLTEVADWQIAEHNERLEREKPKRGSSVLILGSDGEIKRLAKR